MPLTAVSDASALIALEQIGLLEHLAPLFTELAIPPAVAREISPTVVNRPKWVIEHPLTRSLSPSRGGLALGPGESEAIALALELGGHWIILDDRAARGFAFSQGLQVIGTIGLLTAAKRKGLLFNIRPSIYALLDAGFHVSPRLVQAVLADAGEAA